MKLIHTTTYNLYHENIKRDYRVAIISDIHFSYLVTEEKLNELVNYFKSIKPDYILITGDLIDSVDMVSDYYERKRLLNWLSRLGSITTTLISLGNHDFYKKKYYDESKKNGKYCFTYYNDTSFWNKVNNLENVYLLDNDYFLDNHLYVVGVTNSYEYYHSNHQKNKRITENKDKLLEELRELKNKLKKGSENKIKLAMLHSPILLKDLEVQEELDGFDYYLSGHMHNGCVPPMLYEMVNSDLGLIAPNKSLLPRNTRNTLKSINDKLLVTGSVTMFHECSGLMPIFNVMYPTYVSVINFTNNKEYKCRKLKIKKEYIKM